LGRCAEPQGNSPQKSYRSFEKHCKRYSPFRQRLIKFCSNSFEGIKKGQEGYAAMGAVLAKAIVLVDKSGPDQPPHRPALIYFVLYLMNQF